ncbi:hypothetical protein E3N88_35648 [Mikania micrantha]|uniref:Uncharacterized protein n=1 Tax=Mikania micrantha TaxID=192012 RepID=A0A5N6M1V6_9ASTR|nr:hypothetical protein E3N88_35648 [Mikania micrantha]
MKKKQVHRDLKEAMYKQEVETHGNCNRNHEKKGQPYLGDAVQKGETLEEEKRQRWAPTKHVTQVIHEVANEVQMHPKQV